MGNKNKGRHGNADAGTGVSGRAEEQNTIREATGLVPALRTSVRLQGRHSGTHCIILYTWL